MKRIGRYVIAVVGLTALAGPSLFARDRDDWRGHDRDRREYRRDRDWRRDRRFDRDDYRYRRDWR